MGAQRTASRLIRLALVLTAAVAVFAVSLQLGTRADAAGPPYSGPPTEPTGPAYFGPAPNPVPYCENPTYFDPFPENVNPIGRIDVDGAPNASVTTDGITMSFELTAEGAPGTQYPGFFPEGADGGAGDQPKGVEMASDDAATVTLSEPLFYTQWVFTDVDRSNEGFDVTPIWTDPATPGQVAVFGGDANFDFTGTTINLAQFNDTDQAGQPSESINGRVQVDFLGAVQSLTMVRDTGSGQSGFAVGGGCSPIGVAKEVTAGPTWNGSSFDVTYTIRVRNNLPSTATLTADVNAALAAAASGTSAGTPAGIDMTNIQLTDLLTDGAFASVTVESLTNTSGNITVNDSYDGDGDVNIIAAGEVVPAESEEEFVIELQYTPDAAGALGDTCAAEYELLNSAAGSGTASGVEVTDLSDEGVDPDPGVDNGDGGNDDPTVVTFSCPPLDDPALEIVKTVVAGPGGTCPDFAGGVAGDGAALSVSDGETVTYCISVRNTGAGDASNVVVTDPMAPASFDGAIGDLAAGVEAAPLSFDLVVADGQTPLQNTATAAGDGPNGALTPVTDTALIQISLLPDPVLEIVKTVIAGPGGTCPDFAGGVAGDGTPLDANVGDTVTYCISVRNTGAGDATNVVVADPIAPASFDGTIGDLAAGAEAPALSFDLVLDSPGQLANTAGAVGDGPNGPVGPVTDTALVDVSDLPPPVLEIVKTVVAGPGGTCPDFAGGVAGDGTPLDANVGDTVTYCISVRNTGAGDATNVVVADPIAPASFDGTIGDLAAGAEAAALSFDLVLDSVGQLANTAGVVGDGPNGPLGPVTDTALVDVSEAPAPILAIVKTVVAGPNGTCPDFAAGVAGDGTALDVNVGDTVTYCVAVQNSGNAEATSVTVSDPMAPGPIDLGTIPAGGEAAGSYDVLVESDTAPQNTATATGNGPNGPVGPVTDTAIIEVAAPVPSVTIIKTVVPAGGDCATTQDVVDDEVVANAGDPVIWCYVVTNNGNTPLADVLVTDTPVGFTNVDLLTTHAAGIPSLGVGDVVTFQVDGTIPAGGLASTATVVGEASEPDGTLIAGIAPVQDDNDAGVDELSANVSLTKSVSDAGPVPAGTVVTYTLVVSNAGPDAAEDVVIVDMLPTGVRIATLPDTAGWACSSVSATELQCARGEAMASGASETLTYTATVTGGADVLVDLVNTATVTTSTSDPDPTNNEDTDITTRSAPPVTVPAQPEDPGPFTPQEPPSVPAAPVPSPPLAITGSQSSLLVSIAAAFLTLGGMLAIGARRAGEED
jgi:uncharacterized repeat protein (TIGR01451 family)